MTTSHFVVRRVAAAAAAALLVPLAAAVPARAAIPEEPAAPSNLAPDSTAVSTNTPTLSWSRVSGGVKYEVQADDDVDFGSPNFTSTTVNNRAVPTKVLPNGEISWRVRTFNAANVASSWSAASFTVTAAAAPTPISPVGDAVLDPAEPPLLTWSPLTGATSYTVEVDETSDFTSPQISQATQSSSLVVPVPLPQGQFWWRVKATKGTGTDTLFSDPASFVVSELPAPVVVSPTSSVDFEIEDVVLDWQPVAGAQYYEIEVATDADFNSLVVPAVPSKIFGTRYSPATTWDNNQYYWRVRAVDLATNRGPWAQGEFNRVWPDHPTATFPLGTEGSPEVVSGDMYFQWTPVQHASQYELQLGTDPNFSPGTFTLCEIAGTTYTPGYLNNRPHEQCQVLPGTTYHWRVRALDKPLNPTLESIYSETQTFRYDDGDFDTMLPANGATVAVPTLSWDPARGADHYTVAIKDKDGTSVVSATTWSTSYTPVNKLLDPAESPFTWTLTAFDSNNDRTTQIRTRTFNVAGSVPSSGQAPLTPLAGDGDAPTVRAPALTWEPAPGASYYKVWAGNHGTNSFYVPVSGDALGKKLYYPAVTDTWKWFLTPGSYDWYVEAYDAGNALIGTGPLGTFTISQLPPVTGQQIALNGSTLDAEDGCAKAVPDICAGVPATPVFDWDPVDGAGSYLLYLSEDRDFTNLVETTVVPSTSNTRWAPTMSALRSALPDSDAGASYFWFVRPCKTPTACGPSPVSVLDSATNKFRKTSPAVGGLTTTGNAVTDASDITFSWADYRTTNAAATWADTGEAATQSAKTYRIQVDNDANFSSPFDTAEVDQATYTAPGKLYPDTELYWRVQAIDAEGNGLSWSATQPFTKHTQAPALQLPAHGATVNGTAAFTWTAMASAGSYEIQVFRNGDTTASSTNQLFTKSGLKQAAYVWEKPIPFSSQPYVWRVRRRDASNNVGPWSGWRSFSSAGSTPTLLAPAAGATQPTNGAYFTWAPVAGATSYLLEGRSTSSTAKPFNPVTTAATAWATTAVVPNGSWQWRVTAKDAGGAVLGSSAWRGFTVDAIRPTVTTKSPTGTVSRTTNFKVTFSEPVLGVTTSTFQIVRSGTTTPLAAVVTVSADRRSAILNPGVTLKAGTKYTIKVKSGIKDGAGNTLVATSWTVTAS